MESIFHKILKILTWRNFDQKLSMRNFLEETKTIPSRERRLAFIEIEKKGVIKKYFSTFIIDTPLRLSL